MTEPPTSLPLPPPAFLAPAGLQWGTFVASDGAVLRYAHLSVAKPRANCLLVGGFAEFAEKYFETMADLQRRGLAVWFLEWRGQGRSTRPAADPTRPLARNFGRDADDLLRFAEATFGDGTGRLLIAHSTGAAIGLLGLLKRPEAFTLAILSAPMVGIGTRPVPKWLAPAVARAATMLGLGRGRWQGDPQIPSRSRASHDPVRATIV